MIHSVVCILTNLFVYIGIYRHIYVMTVQTTTQLQIYAHKRRIYNILVYMRVSLLNIATVSCLPLN